MRLLALLLPLVALAAKGQDTWTYVHEQPGFDAFATDLVFTSEGVSLTCFYQEETATAFNITGFLAGLDAQGQANYLHQLGNAEHTFFPKSLLSGTDGRLHVLGGYKNLVDTISGFFHLGWQMTGVITDSAIYPMPGYDKAAIDNATLTPGGTIVLGGSLALPGHSFTYTKLIQIDQNGSYINSVQFGSSNVWYGTNARSITTIPQGIVVAVEMAIANRTDFYIYDEDLSLLQTWNELSPNPDPFNPNDSILRGALTLLPLGHDEYIVGGYIVAHNAGLRSALFRMNNSGTILDQFVVGSSNSMDYSALSETIAPLNDSTFYFLSWQNMAAGGGLFNQSSPPTEPDKLHIFKMDLGLNVLCEYVLDGFEDNAYYVPFRIKTAPDGGFVLIGGRKDMNETPSHYVAWARKFAPLDCTVGIDGHATVEQPSIAFPNPGNEGFTILLNGAVTNGAVELYNTTGAVVYTAMLHQGRASVDARRLSPGLYLYRILDTSGQLRSIGKWEKQ